MSSQPKEEEGLQESEEEQELIESSEEEEEDEKPRQGSWLTVIKGSFYYKVKKELNQILAKYFLLFKIRIL